MRSTRYERKLGSARVARPRVARVAVFYTIRPPEAQIGHTIRRRYAARRALRAALRAWALRAGSHVRIPLLKRGLPAGTRTDMRESR